MERQRQRVAIFGALTALVVLIGAVLVVRSQHTQRLVGTLPERGSAGEVLDPIAYLTATEANLQTLLSAPHYLTVRYPHHEGEPFYLEVVPKADPSLARARTKLSCERVHFRVNRGVCVLPPSNSLGTRAVVFDERLQTAHVFVKCLADRVHDERASMPSTKGRRTSS